MSVVYVVELFDDSSLVFFFREVGSFLGHLSGHFVTFFASEHSSLYLVQEFVIVVVLLHGSGCFFQVPMACDLVVIVVEDGLECFVGDGKFPFVGPQSVFSSSISSRIVNEVQDPLSMFLDECKVLW